MSDLLRELPLSNPPRIRSTGVGRHGSNPYESFHLPGLWCLHLFRDELDLRVGDHRFQVTPGTVTVMPPSTLIEYYFPRPAQHVHVYALFEASGDIVEVPALQQPGAIFDRLYRDFEALIGWAPVNLRRAESRLWELLWTVAGLRPAPSADPLVSAAMEIIELHLGEPITVAQLAERLNVSHNHLTRSFQTALGMPPVQFIRDRRVRKAEELLLHTTIPIKAIAAQTGLGDFHTFNKIIRRARGLSPRDLRKGNLPHA